MRVDDPEKDNPDRDAPAYAPVYADQLRFLGPFDRVFSSEANYDRFARELGAEPVTVDAARGTVPISGTEIRADLFAHRGWLDPLVYSSLIRKVVFVGTESAGKSTLARACAEEFGTLWTHEFGRELWEAQGLYRLIRRPPASGPAAVPTRRSGAPSFAPVPLLRHERLDHPAVVVAELRHSRCASARAGGRHRAEYFWVVCDNDFGWVQDGTRELAGGRADAFQRQQLADLARRELRPLVVSGPVAARVAQVRAALESS